MNEVLIFLKAGIAGFVGWDRQEIGTVSSS